MVDVVTADLKNWKKFVEIVERYDETNHERED